MNNNPFIQRQMEIRQHMIGGFSGILVASDEVEKAEPVFDENLFEKAECYIDDLEKAHQDGDIHPKHPNWVWVSSAAGGKGDWRAMGGRAHKKHQETNGTSKKEEGGDEQKQGNEHPKMTANEKKQFDEVVDKGFKIVRSSYSDTSKMSLLRSPKGNWRCYYDGKDTGNTISGKIMSDATAKKLGLLKNDVTESVAKTVEEHASSTKTETLEKVINSNAPEKLKEVAKKELEKRNKSEKSDVTPGMKRLIDHIINNDGGAKGDTNKFFENFEKIIKEEGITEEQFNAIQQQPGIKYGYDLGDYSDYNTKSTKSGKTTDDSKNKQSKKTERSDKQQQRFIRQAGENIASKYLDHLNGKDESSSYLDEWAKYIDDGENTADIYKEAELALDGKLFDLMGGQDAVDKELKQFKSELDSLHNHTGKKEHQGRTEQQKTQRKVSSADNAKNSASKEITDIFNQMDEWDDDDWMDTKKSGEAITKIEQLVSDGDIDEKEFYKLKPQWLDMSYEEVSGTKVGTDKIKNLIEQLNNWSDDDFMNQGKNRRWSDELSRAIKKHDITEDQFKKITKKYPAYDLLYDDYKK